MTTQDPARRRRGVPLVVFLFAALASVSVVGVGVLGVAQADRWEQVQLAQAQALEQLTANSVSREVGAQLSQHLAALELLAEELENTEPPERPATLARVRERYPAFAVMYLAGTDGVSTIAVPALMPDGTPAAGRDYSDRDYFQQLLRTGHSAVSRVQIGRMTGVPNVQLAAPVHHKGALTGVLAASLDLGVVGATCDQITRPLKGITVTVLDREGRALTAARPGAAMRDLGALPLYAPATGEGQRAGRDEAGLEVFAATSVVTTLDLRWTVLVTRATADVRAESATARGQTAGAAAAALAVSLALAALLAAWLSRPIGALAALATEVQRSGRLAPAPRGVLPAEVGEVIDAVQGMIGKLQHQAAALEHTVAERTAELTLSNHELELTLARWKDAQTRMALSERLTSIGTLAAGVAHEINNPLTFVLSNLAFALEELSEDPPDRAAISTALKDAEQGAERVKKIVRDLHLFARSTEDSQRIVEVPDVLRATLNVAANELRHRARLLEDLQPVPPVRADESRLAQVFLNLVLNAAQAMPEQTSARNELRVATRTDAQGRAVIEFTDTGEGIAPELLGRIFEPFFTTRPVGEGTGMGLSVCHGIVRAMGGEILVRSEPGKGSTFTVVLPAAKEAAPAAAAPSARPARAKLLVVDDEPLVGRSVQRMLGHEHELEVVESGKLALERLHAGARYDVIVCDVMMPEMSAEDLYREVQRAWPAQAARFVFVTGGAFSPQAEAFLAGVGAPCVGKPFDWAELREAIATVLHAHPAPPEV